VRAVRAAAGRVVELAYQKLLATAIAAGRLPLVVFMSGGNGAGKSTSVPADSPEHIVFDSTLSQFAPSVRHIDAALDAGFDIDIRHLARHPEAAWEGVLNRAVNEGRGRTVTVAGHVATHIGSRTTFVALVKHYSSDSRVNFLVWDNDGVELERRSLDWLRARRYPEGDELQGRLHATLELARRRGDITEAIYEGCKGAC
jgi:hypothetical protein